MNRKTKADTAAAIRAAGLEMLPTYRITSAADLLDATLEHPVLASATHLTLRASEEWHVRNSPRYIGVDRQTVTQRLLDDPGSAFLLQIYDRLIYSAEIQVGDMNGIYFELMPGIWELDSQASPAHGLLCRNQVARLSIPNQPQPAEFWDLDTSGRVTMMTCVSDWHVASLAEWVFENWDTVHFLLADDSGPTSMKIHYYAEFGISPQNIHPTHSIRAPSSISTAIDVSSLPVLRGLEEDAPVSPDVVIDFSVARERSGDLRAFASRLYSAGARTAFIRGGLLSHLAIQLREAGLQVYVLR